VIAWLGVGGEAVALALLVAGGASVTYAEAGFRPSQLTADQRAALEDGEVLVEPLEPTGGGGAAVRGIALLDSSPERVWEVVRRCGRFEEFMPRVVESGERDRDGPAVTCHVRIDLPFPLGEAWADSRSVERALAGGGYQRSWRLLRGSYEHLLGSFRVLPWPEHRSLLVYEVDAQPSAPVPDFLIRAVTMRTLPEGLRAIERRARASAQ
jgi:hypothetical protein